MMAVSRAGVGGSRTVVAALISAARVLAGCSGGSTVADHLPTAIGGLPERSPQRPTTSSGYPAVHDVPPRSEEHTSELQSHLNPVCRLLLEKKKMHAGHPYAVSHRPHSATRRNYA